MKNIIQAFAYFGVGSIFNILAQVVKGKMAAIFLGVEGVGLFSQVTNLWGFLYTISGLGFYNGIVRRISAANNDQYNDHINSQLISSFIFLTVFSIGTTALSVAFSFYISNIFLNDKGAHQWVIILAFMSAPFAVVSQVYSGLFNGLRLVKLTVLVQIISDMVGLIIFIILIYGGSLFYAVLAFSITNILKLIIQIVIGKKYLPKYNLSFSMSNYCWLEVRHNISYGFSGLLMVILGVAAVTLVSTFIINLYGIRENGYFSAAWKVCAIYFGALNASASGYLFPALSAAKNNNEIKVCVNEALTLYLYVLPPVAFFILIGGDYMMEILFSKNFIPAAALLLWFLPGDVARTSAETIGLTFLAKGKVKLYFGIYLLWALLFVVLTYILIRIFGILGVGYAYIISHGINLIIIIALANKNFELNIEAKVTAMFIAGLSLVASGAFLVNIADKLSTRVLYSFGLFLAWFFWCWRDNTFRIIVRMGADKFSRVWK